MRRLLETVLFGCVWCEECAELILKRELVKECFYICALQTAHSSTFVVGQCERFIGTYLKGSGQSHC
jgi:hypothetical protein